MWQTRELSLSKITLFQGITFFKLESLQKWANEMLQEHLVKIRRAKNQKFKIRNQKIKDLLQFQFSILKYEIEQDISFQDILLPVLSETS